MSGSQIGGVVGAAIGFVVTAGNPAGAQWGYGIGPALGGYIDPEEVHGPHLKASSGAVAPVRPYAFGQFPSILE